MSAVRLATALIGAGLLLCAGPAHAAVHCVGGGGPDCTGPVHPSVTAAVATAGDGDTIRIAAGQFSYDGPVIAKQLSFQGAGIRRTTIVRATGLNATLPLERSAQLTGLTVIGRSDAPEEVPTGGHTAISFGPTQPGRFLLWMTSVAAVGGTSRRLEQPLGPPGLFVTDGGAAGREVAVHSAGGAFAGGTGAGFSGRGIAAQVTTAGGASFADSSFNGITGLVMAGGGLAALTRASLSGGLRVQGARVIAERSVVRGEATASSTAQSPATLELSNSLVAQPFTDTPFPPAPFCSSANGIEAFGSGARPAAILVRGSTVITNPVSCEAVSAVSEAGATADTTVQLRNSILRQSPDGSGRGRDLRARGPRARIEAAASSFTTVAAEQGGSVPVPGSAGNISGDPRLADPSRGSCLLLADSPLIDRGNPAFLRPGEVDLLGSHRSIGLGPDIGACEAPEPAPVVTRFRVSRKRFVRGRRTTFRYTLSRPARTEITLRRCVAAKARNRTPRRCRRYRRVGVIRRSITTAGPVRTPWRGRKPGSRKRLRPGLFRATIVAKSGVPEKRSEPRRVFVRILPPA